MSLGTLIKTSSSYFDNLFYEIIEVDKDYPYALFVHGGPGLHSESVTAYFKEYIIKPNTKINWIFFDQRGCGRSKTDSITDLTHQRNMSDLNSFINYLQLDLNINLNLVVGHSYGSWLAYDTFVEFKRTEGLILLAISEDLFLPRLNSVHLELLMLKEQKPEYFKSIYSDIKFSGPLSWKYAEEIREKLDNFEFRSVFYWFNLDAEEKYTKIDLMSKSKNNNEIFYQTRKSIFNNGPTSCFIDESKIKGKVLRIIGFYDFLMGGKGQARNIRTHIYYGSSHYPHIEESDLFYKDIQKILEEILI